MTELRRLGWRLYLKKYAFLFVYCGHKESTIEECRQRYIRWWGSDSWR